MKLSVDWHSPRLRQTVQVRRWGHYGRPVLVFPTAGGDAEEIERFLMLRVLDPLLQEGRIKVYSCDSVAGAAWVKGESNPRHAAWVQNQFDGFIYHELVPAIRADCGHADVDIIAAGASIGAYNAVASVCRHPDVFSHGLGLSGTYDLTRWIKGEWSPDFYFCSPLHYLPGLNDSAQLRRLRERFIILATGEGRWESPAESWAMARVLGDKGIPNRVDLWGKDRDHDWTTWREMLPKYLGDLTAGDPRP